MKILNTCSSLTLIVVSFVFLFQCCVALKGSGYYPPYCGADPLVPIVPSFSPKPNANLVQVQALIRHGDRTIATGTPCWNNDTTVYNCSLHSTCAPNNDQNTVEYYGRVFREQYLPNREDFPGNCKTGQLTHHGYLQEINNGQFFRYVYVDSLKFLPNSYDSNKIWLRSDDEQRTMQSLQGFTNGLYPTSSSSDEIEIIDFFTMDENLDDMTPNSVLCPMFTIYQNYGMNSTAFLDHLESVQPLYQQLEAVTGLQITPLTLGHLWDCMNVHLCWNETVPSWLTYDLYQSVAIEVMWEQNYLLTYPSAQECGQVGIGFLITEIYKEMQLALNGSTSYKFLLYSGHDYSLMALLCALQLNDSIWPAYASWAIFELWKDSGNNGQYSVRLIYNNVVQILPGCTEFCYWESFVKIITPLIPNPTVCNSSEFLKKVYTDPSFTP